MSCSKLESIVLNTTLTSVLVEDPVLDHKKNRSVRMENGYLPSSHVFDNLNEFRRKNKKYHWFLRRGKPSSGGNQLAILKVLYYRSAIHSEKRGNGACKSNIQTLWLSTFSPDKNV